MTFQSKKLGPEFLCVGYCCYDITFLISGFPTENSKCETRDSIESGGGPAANAAYLLSLWGASCAFAGVLGDDPYGHRVLHEFELARTDVSLLQMEAGLRTPLSLILVNRTNGNRTLINRKDSKPPMTIPRNALSKMNPKMLLFDGHEPDASLQALQAYPAAISILDAGSARDGTLTLASKVHYLVASEKFACSALGVPYLDPVQNGSACMRRLREQFPTKVVVTLGERGLVADDGNGYLHLPACQAKAQDTTAAGDTFHGAFAWSIARNTSFKQALEFSSMAAAISVERLGGRPAIPSWQEVNEQLQVRSRHAP